MLQGSFVDTFIGDLDNLNLTICIEMHSVDASYSVVPLIVSRISPMIHYIIIVSEAKGAIMTSASSNVLFPAEYLLRFSIKGAQWTICSHIAHSIRVIAPSIFQISIYDHTSNTRATPSNTGKWKRTGHPVRILTHPPTLYK